MYQYILTPRYIGSNLLVGMGVDGLNVKAFTLRLDKEMHRDLKTKAALEGTTMQNIIVRLIAKELERETIKN